MPGMIHFSFTTRLNQPENFETCCFETIVTPRLSLFERMGLSGLKRVTPRLLSWSMSVLICGETLSTIEPPFSTFCWSGDCLPVSTSITASCVWRFNVSQSVPNLGLSKTFSASWYT